jgi:sugar/nucleoside kinase (ribokinase family)
MNSSSTLILPDSICLVDQVLRERDEPVHILDGDPILPPLLIISNLVVNRVWQVDRYGGKVRSRPLRSPGGFMWEALRQAITLGFEVVAASARGQDAAGDFLEATLRDTGADISGLRAVPFPTATAEVIVTGKERTILIEDGTSAATWSPQPDDLQYFDRVGWVLAGGTLSDEALSWILKAARDRGRPVALIQVSRADLSNFGLDPDIPPRDAAAVFQKLGVNLICITDDANPEQVFTSLGREVTIPSIPERRPLFPTGTGDASFIARLAGLIRFGQDCLDSSIGLGSSAGGFFVENGRPGTWSELEALGQEWPIGRRRARCGGRHPSPCLESSRPGSQVALEAL